MKKKFAFVQWIGGEYADTYTAGRIQSLENEIKILEGAVSPLRPAPADDTLERPVGKKLDDVYDNVEEPEAVASTSTSDSTQKRKSAEQGTMEATLEAENRRKKKHSGQGSGHEMEQDRIDELLAVQPDAGGINIVFVDKHHQI
ncbi:Protein of unknown function [Cotesia congregata]|uniref:Uncharacterized protein n=1 Tax=Cotesia congregata TaxID=51543 RepID=A0A8J2HNJ4_COTCN|nr:Protein of unknown function [Cotesia congregata]